VNSWKITALCLLAPACCYIISRYSAAWLGGFQIGIELLLINGILTFGGLWALSEPAPATGN